MESVSSQKRDKHQCVGMINYSSINDSHENPLSHLNSGFGSPQNFSTLEKLEVETYNLNSRRSHHYVHVNQDRMSEKSVTEGGAWNFYSKSNAEAPSVQNEGCMTNSIEPSQSVRHLKPMKLQFFKTKLCPWILSTGFCRKATACRYAHTPEEVRPLPDLRRTKLCPIALQEGQCWDKGSCRYAHTYDELRATQIFSKIKLCPLWLVGNCPKSSNVCRFAHGEQDLRYISEGACTTSDVPVKNDSCETKWQEALCDNQRPLCTWSFLPKQLKKDQSNRKEKEYLNITRFPNFDTCAFPNVLMEGSAKDNFSPRTSTTTTGKTRTISRQSPRTEFRETLSDFSHDEELWGMRPKSPVCRERLNGKNKDLNGKRRTVTSEPGCIFPENEQPLKSSAKLFDSNEPIRSGCETHVLENDVEPHKQERILVQRRPCSDSTQHEKNPSATPSPRGLACQDYSSTYGRQSSYVQDTKGITDLQTGEKIVSPRTDVPFMTMDYKTIEDNSCYASAVPDGKTERKGPRNLLSIDWLLSSLTPHHALANGVNPTFNKIYVLDKEGLVNDSHGDPVDQDVGLTKEFVCSRSNNVPPKCCQQPKGMVESGEPVHEHHHLSTYSDRGSSSDSGAQTSERKTRELTETYQSGVKNVTGGDGAERRALQPFLQQEQGSGTVDVTLNPPLNAPLSARNFCEGCDTLDARLLDDTKTSIRSMNCKDVDTSADKPRGRLEHKVKDAQCGMNYAHNSPEQQQEKTENPNKLKLLLYDHSGRSSSARGLTPVSHRELMLPAKAHQTQAISSQNYNSRSSRTNTGIDYNARGVRSPSVALYDSSPFNVAGLEVPYVSTHRDHCPCVSPNKTRLAASPLTVPFVYPLGYPTHEMKKSPMTLDTRFCKSPSSVLFPGFPFSPFERACDDSQRMSLQDSYNGYNVFATPGLGNVSFNSPSTTQPSTSNRDPCSTPQSNLCKPGASRGNGLLHTFDSEYAQRHSESGSKQTKCFPEYSNTPHIFLSQPAVDAFCPGFSSLRHLDFSKSHGTADASHYAERLSMSPWKKAAGGMTNFLASDADPKASNGRYSNPEWIPQSWLL